MITKTKPNHSLLESFQKVAEIVASVINMDYLEEIIGRTHLQYLLVYVVGLIILEGKKTMSGIAESLQLCFHDSLCRLLWYMEFPLKKLSMFFISFILRNRKAPGWLIIDGTGIPKQFSKFIECTG